MPAPTCGEILQLLDTIRRRDANRAAALETADDAAVLDAAADFPYAISLDPDDYWVRVADTDVTEAIREPRVSAAVSGVARVGAVRERVNDLFRTLVRNQDIQNGIYDIHWLEKFLKDGGMGDIA